MSDTIVALEKVLKLKKPLTVGDKTITELTLREPTAAELEIAEENGKKSDTARTIQLVALASGVHAMQIKNLVGSDLARAAKIVTDFLDIGPDTGENS